jgi:hypothetical protein
VVLDRGGIPVAGGDDDLPQGDGRDAPLGEQSFGRSQQVFGGALALGMTG